jgi:hypothetical protein
LRQIAPGAAAGDEADSIGGGAFPITGLVGLKNVHGLARS